MASSRGFSAPLEPAKRAVRPRSPAALCLLNLALLAGGCGAPELGSLCAPPADATPEQKLAAVCACQHGLSEDWSSFYRRRRLDLLFVVSNTSSMVKKQLALAQALPPLLSLLEGDDLDYHIGVVSTDVGSWMAAGTPWTLSAGSCDSFAGDDGRLQAASCLDRSTSSAAAASACAAVCPDRKFLPNDGQPFLARKNGKVNVPAALRPDPKTGVMVDYGPTYALQCMAMLGDHGCAISAPLESARRALDGHLSANSGFLRPDAPLYIVFLTDGDDCSVQLARRGDNDPHTQSCTTPDPNAAASCYSLGAYRCLARDVVCDQPMNVAGSKTGCRERADSYLEPLDKYVQFFSALKSPNRLIAAGIWTLPALAQAAKLEIVQNPNVGGSAGLEFATGSAASCQDASDPTLTGQAQLRLSQFLAAVNPRRSPWDRAPPEVSVCSPADYFGAFDPLGIKIHERWAPTCLPGLPVFLADGSPACVVGDVPYDSPQAVPESPMPVCGAQCCGALAASFFPPQKDHGIQMACAGEPADCYCAAPSRSLECGGNAELRVWRKDNGDSPADTIVSSRCALQCTVPPGPSSGEAVKR